MFSFSHTLTLFPHASFFRTLISLEYNRYTSPCYRNATTQRLQCLPLYQILGVSKCGTTDIYARLGLHPDFYDSRNKGPHWWDECNYPLTDPCTVGGKGVSGEKEKNEITKEGTVTNTVPPVRFLLFPNLLLFPSFLVTQDSRFRTLSPK
jgi:hypothetical protein